MSEMAPDRRALRCVGQEVRESLGGDSRPRGTGWTTRKGKLLQ